jgi:carboxyl-terminal processing protease
VTLLLESDTLQLMKFSNTRWPTLKIALIVLFVSACTQKKSPKVTANDNYPIIVAKEVFSIGFENISERYIEIASPAQFTVEGLKGLGSIDPAITFAAIEGEVILKVNNKIAGRLSTPKTNDANGWAELTVKMVSLGRQVSAEMKEATTEKIYEAVFDSILSSFDIYSRYAGASEAEKNREKRDGFGGIGIRFRIIKDLPEVIRIIPNTPAFRAGLKLGDRMTHAGSVSLSGLRQGQITDKLRGPIDSNLSLSILRKGESGQLLFKIKRALIVMESVSYEHHKGIVFIKIRSFNQNTARDTLKKLKKAHEDLGNEVKGIVLDMRGNSGGLLGQSIKVADLFLANGRISETRGRHPDSLQSYDASGRDMAYGRPVVVLVDGNSASAAEVTAAALQDQGRAIIIGTSSFGKGTVQTVIRLPNEGEITLTWSRLIAPSGYKLHGLGIFPMICTSGIDDNTINGESVIKKALANQTKTTKILKAWRNISYSDKQRSKQLRSFCPPERRKYKLDSTVAETMLHNKALYAFTLDLSVAAVAAR